MKRAGLRLKITLLVALLLSVIFTVMTAYIALANTERLQSDLLTNAKSFASLATDPIGNNFLLYKDGGSFSTKLAVSRMLDLDPLVSNVTIVDLNGAAQYVQSGVSHSISPQLAST